MTFNLATKIPVICTLCLLLSTAAVARNNAAPVTIDGLHLVPDTQLGLVYADPEADLSGYDELLLMDAQIAFRKNWRQEINRNKPFRVSTQDMQRIKADVAELFSEVFTRELETAGLPAGISPGRQCPAYPARHP